MPTLEIPAPVGGINVAANWLSMPMGDAFYLYDMVPKKAHVETAPPSYLYYDDAATVMSLLPYEAGSNSELLGLFGSGTSWAVKRITGGTATSLFTGLLNGRYMSCMFQSNMVLCNGVNAPLVYNGSTVAAISGTAAIMPDIRGVITFKGRAYYWQLATQSFWYAAAGAFQGTLTEFSVDTLTTLGGKIVLLTAFTRDGGEGSDDLFVIVMDTGETLVYQGDDPSNAAAWELVGKFIMPRPIGPRCSIRMNSTTLVLTEEGLIDLQKVLAGEPYLLVSFKVDPWLKFKITTLTDEEREQIALVEVAETQSIMVLHLELCDGAALGAMSAPLAMTKETGAWYLLPLMLSDSSQAIAINCATQWLGKTYFGRGTSGAVYGILPEVVTLASADETMSYEWTPVSGYGFAFAPTITSLVQKLPSETLVDSAVSTFVQPFGGLSGQVSMLQTVKGTVQERWDTSKDQVKWYKSVMRIKPGGRR